jgi:putative intracellular protease/amidase
MFRRSLFSRPTKPSNLSRRFGLEQLETRDLMAADPLPVLMVLADQQDFYYQEYGDTRISLEAAGLDVKVAAATTNPTFPHQGTGEGSGSGMVTPDIALADADASDYSAIVFVGGWGSSMYQYDFPGDYGNNRYDGDLATKAAVNDLINDFVDQDKYVTAICHGVTVLAWARVDGVSPLAGKQVSVPWIGSPAVEYEGQWYANFQLMQYPQVTANGALANTVSGQYGDPTTVADDVIVDGRIITAENFDSARYFGQVIAGEVIAAADSQDNDDDPPPPVNQAPVVGAGEFDLNENSAAGTIVGVVSAMDPDAGQSLTFAIGGGNTAGAFAINPVTGVLTVANADAIDFETNPVFELTIQATDDGAPALSASATVTINLRDLAEPASSPFSRVGSDLVVQGTPTADRIYVWTNHFSQAFAWLNGQMSGPHTLPAGGHVRVFSGAGNDQVYATDSKLSVRVYGEAGNDQITGGWADDVLDGGEGIDRIWGMQGNDLILGGAGDDFLDGREGDDLVVGGDGNDKIYGFTGRDVLIGGLGTDRVDGGAGEDLLIGGTTSYDANELALLALLAEWRGPGDFATRTTSMAGRLQKGTWVLDDSSTDCLLGGDAADWLFLAANDCHQAAIVDLVTR